LENLAVAVRGAEVAGGVGLAVPPEAVGSGVASTVWEARLELVPGEPELLIDSAHNPLAASALACYLEKHPRPSRVLLFGVMEDKKAEAILGPLQPLVGAMVATRPANRRALDPEWLVALAGDRGLPAEAAEPPKKALFMARRLAGKDGQVVVAGSTFLAGDVKRLLEEEKEQGQELGVRGQEGG
jgi:dihydrofolate synthase/folylpolyglutamate synthase